MHTGVEVTQTNCISNQVDLHDHEPISAAHPGKVDITAALHMASRVDAHKAHDRCPPPKNPGLRRRPRPLSLGVVILFVFQFQTYLKSMLPQPLQFLQNQLFQNPSSKTIHSDLQNHRHGNIPKCSWFCVSRCTPLMPGADAADELVSDDERAVRCLTLAPHGLPPIE
jgi:hypothetical protein